MSLSIFGKCSMKTCSRVRAELSPGPHPDRAPPVGCSISGLADVPPPQSRTHKGLIDAESRRQNGPDAVPLRPLSGADSRSSFLLTFAEAVLVFSGGPGSGAGAPQIRFHRLLCGALAICLISGSSVAREKNLRLRFQICVCKCV